MAFDKSKYLIKVQGGREYLPVAARLVWFREEHPDWSIITSPVEINLEKQYAIFNATIMNADGKVMATATKMENVRGFGDYLEKAETGAVGRALAYCGYGTQFAPELEEGAGRPADAPFGGTNRFPNGNNPNVAANRYNSGPRPAAQRPVPAPPPPPADEERDFGDENENAFEEPAPRPAPFNRVAERPAAPVPARPAPPADEDFGGPARADEDDPFADLDGAAPARPTAPPVRAAAARAAAASQQNEAGEPVLTTNRCSEEGCPVTLTPSQLNLSVAKFGRALCPRHQKDATPLAAAGGGAPKRSNGAAGPMTESLL